MSDKDRATPSEQLIVRMQAARGYIYPEGELFEVLEATLVPGGAPTFHCGLNALLNID